MDNGLREQFLQRWERYFPGAELPIGLFYTDQQPSEGATHSGERWACMVATLTGVRKGKTAWFASDHIGCMGGKRYLGFDNSWDEDFPYFLSCGKEGLEGERYLKTPELVRQWLAQREPFEAPARYVVFKRFDRFAEDETPAVVVFLAPPDVLSGLFTLVNFPRADQVVTAPFSSGCGSIVALPMLEGRREQPHAVLGMFDVSARPFVPADRLSLSVPWSLFERMAENMDESFLITESWQKVAKRMGRAAE